MLIEMNFRPAAGREIDKRRPAIVLSPVSYNRPTGFCLAVPTTSDLTPGPFWIPMPPGYLPLPGLVLCDYVRSVDYRDRSAMFLNRVPTELVEQIVSITLDLVDPIA